MAQPDRDEPVALETQASTAGTPFRPIWEVFEEISRSVPEEELRKLPEDGAEQRDHYIYGTTKRALGGQFFPST